MCSLDNFTLHKKRNSVKTVYFIVNTIIKYNLFNSICKYTLIIYVKLVCNSCHLYNCKCNAKHTIQIVKHFIIIVNK